MNKTPHNRFKDSPTTPCHAEITFRSIELERMDYEARVEIDRRQIERCAKHGKTEMFMDMARDRLVMTMRDSIYGKKHPERHVVRYPETWWDAVKERFAPAWFRDRYPVRFVSISVTLDELYPEIEPSLPDKDPVMRFLVREKLESPVW